MNRPSIARLGRLSVAGAALLLPGLAHAGQTIVGTWSTDPRTCAPMNAVYVGPLSLMMGDEFRCSFQDVSRSGEVVTWHGGCGMPEQPKDRSTVVAERRGKFLHIWLNGAHDGPYQRCRSD